MSQPESEASTVAAAPQPRVQKQGFNIYTMMLLIACSALVIGCVLLWLELSEFGEYPWWNTTGARPSVFNWGADLMPEALKTWRA